MKIRNLMLVFVGIVFVFFVCEKDLNFKVLIIDVNIVLVIILFNFDGMIGVVYL